MSMGQNVNVLLSSVPKLDGQNYHNWKFAISMVLQRAGCWEEVVSGNGDKGNKPKTRSDDGKLEKWEAAAEEELTFIGLTIAPSQYRHIHDATDGPMAWKASLTASKDEFKLANVTGTLIDEEGRRSGGDKKDE
jgi:hypothetical protein